MSDLIDGLNRPIERWTFTTATTRAVAGNYTHQDIGKLAYQSDYGTYYRLTAVGATPTWASILKPATVTIFSAAAAGATYGTPDACQALFVECLGAGGAGGGAAAASSNLSLGGGGSGGGYACKYITSPASSYTYTVGAGGVGVQGTTGGTGGDTSFGVASVCTATGGGGGGTIAAGTALGSVAGAVAPGAGTVGDLLLTGQPGGWGTRYSGSVGSAGMGAPAIMFGGGGGNSRNSNGNGNNSTSNGAGGGGSFTTGSAGTGGTGGDGLIRIWEFY